VNIKLIVLLAIIIVLSIFLIVNYVSGNIRNSVLNHLEDNLEFCEIEKENINVLSSSGVFWMTCNERPFYAEYKDGNIKYELNGWNWLENTDYWNELNTQCDFYYPEDGNLRFFCYENDEPVLKYYSFNRNSFTINKIKEENFVVVLTKDLKSKYSFLEQCGLTDYDASGTYAPYYVLYFSCDNQDYKVSTNLAYVFISPKDVTEVGIRTTFENVFGVEPNIENSKASASLSFGDITIYYSNASFSLVPSKELDIVMKELGNKFLLNFDNAEESVGIELVKDYNNMKFYKIDDVMVRIQILGNAINSIVQKREGFV